MEVNTKIREQRWIWDLVYEAEVGSREGAGEPGADGEGGGSEELPKTLVSVCCCSHGCMLKTRSRSDPLSLIRQGGPDPLCKAVVTAEIPREKQAWFIAKMKSG